MSEQKGLALGIDLGGTTVKVGVVNHHGAIIGRGQRATEVEKGPEGVIHNMALAAADALADAGVSNDALDGAGVGAPGICDAPNGVVVSAGNLHWKQVPVGSLLSERLGLPVKLENDANCAALGEQWCGAARGCRHVILFTLGTGVGGGLILDGRIYGGAIGWAGELGHMPIIPDGAPCTCGGAGCLETVASATAMGLAARREIEAGRSPAMARIAREQGGKPDARVVILAAQEGDEVARGILRQVGIYLGQASASLVSALNPELIVIGGGASRGGEFLLEPMRETILRMAMPGPAQVVRVVAATLGNDAGLIGAASLVWR
ncbi:MAG: ROK family protein [Bacillota bacterium]